MGFEIIFMNKAIKIINNTIYHTNNTEIRNRANHVEIKFRWSFSVLLLDVRFSCNKRILFLLQFICQNVLCKRFLNFNSHWRRKIILYFVFILHTWNCWKWFMYATSYFKTHSYSIHTYRENNVMSFKIIVLNSILNVDSSTNKILFYWVSH